MTDDHDLVEQGLASPDRLCPVLAGPAFVRGKVLSIRLHDGERVVNAPARFLTHIWKWCDGGRTLAEIRTMATKEKLGTAFSRLVDAMLEAGILVDAARSLLTAAAVARYPSVFGMAAPPHVWKQVVARLPDDLPNSATPLPSPRATPLAELFGRRRSAVEFVSTPLDPAALAGILHALYGSVGRRRSVASAGAFYQLKITACLLRRVGEWAPGVYQVHYADGRCGLEQVADAPSSLARAFVQPLRLKNASLVVVLSCDLLPGTLKYRNRYFQYALLEAGSALQNAALACAQSGIGWRILGGFEEARLAEILKLDPALPLAAAVGGAEPEQDAHKAKAIEVLAGWVGSLPGAEFHTATARARVAGGEWSRPCWGRDANPMLALDRAVAESVERLAYRQARDFIRATAEDLARPWLPADAFVRYAVWQYKQDGFPFARFHPKQQRLWTEVQRLDGEAVLVPAELVLHRTALPPEHQARLATHASSSGCASHRTTESAFSSALLELVERDAFSRHWLQQRPGDRLRYETLPAGIAAEVNRLQRAGVEVELQCLNAGPVAAWLAFLQSAERSFTCVGASSGLDPEAALWSALREAQTGALVRLSDANRRRLRPEEVLTPRDHADLYAQPRHYRRADALRTPQANADFNEVSRAWPRSMGDVVDALRRHDKTRDILLVDLSFDNPPTTWDGAPLRTVRALVTELVPLAFGHGRMPFGMVNKPAPGSRFPHPFP